MSSYGAGYFYSVIRETGFDKKVKELCRTYKRMSELDEAIDWALSRKPHYFDNVIDNYYLWVTETLLNEDFPKVKILYQIDEESRIVTLISIEED